MEKIWKSGIVVLAVAAAVGGATYSFFSDEEVSAGNTFTAGAIDLKIDSVSHYNGMVCTLVGNGYVWIPESEVDLNEDNQPVASEDMNEEAEWDLFNTNNPNQYPQAGVECVGTWPLADLGTGQPAVSAFFNFDDVKPGDMGENTVSIHVDSNDAWMCASLENVDGADLDATKTEPEVAVDDSFADELAASELDENLHFFAWVDDGDNVYDPSLEGDADVALGDPVTASELTEQTWMLAGPNFNGGAPIAGGETQYIGIQWCAGDMTVEGSTITCNGENMDNEAQTDSWSADLAFYVEQSRNNPDFVCPVREESAPTE